jgi:hypothetical protein
MRLATFLRSQLRNLLYPLLPLRHSIRAKRSNNNAHQTIHVFGDPVEVSSMPLPRRGYPPFFVILSGPEAAVRLTTTSAKTRLSPRSRAISRCFTAVNGVPSHQERRSLFV